MLRHEAQAIDGIVAETRTQTFDERRRLAGETATVFTGPPERRGTRDHRPQASGAQFEAGHRRGQDGARKMLGEQRSERGGTMLGGRQPQVQLGVQRDRGATLLGVSRPVREPQHQQVDPTLSGAQEVFELDEQGLGLAQHGRCGIGFEGGIAACAEALARHMGAAWLRAETGEPVEIRHRCRPETARKASAWQALRSALMGTAGISGMILFIILGATTFAQLLSFSGASNGLVQLITGQGWSKEMIVVGMMALLIFLGLFVDQVSMMMITLPIFMPIVSSLGIDPVWFGVMFLMCMQMGLLLPPHGLLLMTMRGVAPPEVRTSQIFQAVTPYVLMSVLLLLAIFFWPAIATWLPSRL